MRYSTTLYGKLELNSKVSPLRPIGLFVQALTASSNSLDQYEAASNPKDGIKNSSNDPKIIIDDPNEEEKESVESSIITPIVKGRYAKHREHWNTIMAKAQATERVSRVRQDGIDGYY
jgi:hypothetical protein